MEVLELLLSLVPILLIGLGYVVGHLRERSHIKSLDQREATFKDILVTDLKTVPDPDSVADARLVMGDAVIATDYFKSFASQLRNLVGGEVGTLETLVNRARREALVRLLYQAQRMGATEVHNVRLETSNVLRRAGRSAAISAELFAYGTAVVRRQ